MTKFNFSARNEGKRATRIVMLIVCEGARTEPNYFYGFKLPKKVLEIDGAGMNTESIVKLAIQKKKAYGYDEVWCVFDRDSFPPKRIINAFKLAKANNIKIAFSNESFELWYLLHFCYLDTKITRVQYCQKLSEYFGFNYEKNNPDIYQLLLAKQADAIRNAKRLDKATPTITGQEHLAIPTTSVYQLVERLNKLMARQTKQVTPKKRQK